MKRAVFIFSLIFIVFSFKIFGQEFSFQMTFIDAVGNSDTLIFGYDNDATDSVDAEFGEVNIMNIELDSIFDVRVTNEWHVRAGTGYEYRSKFHIKKQIVKKNCDTWAEPMSIDVKCSNWPVRAIWDSNLFIIDPCREGSGFTSMSPGAWDVLTPSNLYMCILSDHADATFTSNANEFFYPGDFGQNSYKNSDNDTISVFWVIIGTNAIWSSILQEPGQNSIIIYPNPSHDYIKLNAENNLAVSSIEVYDMTGRKQDVAVCGDGIEIRKLVRGLYFLKIADNENRIIVKQFIKY